MSTKSVATGFFSGVIVSAIAIVSVPVENIGTDNEVSIKEMVYDDDTEIDGNRYEYHYIVGNIDCGTVKDLARWQEVLSPAKDSKEDICQRRFTKDKRCADCPDGPCQNGINIRTGLQCDPDSLLCQPYPCSIVFGQDEKKIASNPDTISKEIIDTQEVIH